MITSSSNEFVKFIRKLREKKFRDLNGLAFIEGTKLVIDAQQQGAVIEKLIITDSYEQSIKRQDINHRLSSLTAEKISVSDEVFQTISSKENPQGIGALIKQDWLPFETLRNKFSGLWVALWEIADPGNLGSIMRTVDAVGARGIILIGNCTDPYDPGAVRGSMGAIFSNILVKSNMQEFVGWVSTQNIAVYGTSDAAKTYYRATRYPQDMILAMGSERQGLPEEVIISCRSLVQIPMGGTSDSLNLAVATGIVLYEIYDQNFRKGSDDRIS